jgi:hypothetical protein
MEFSNQKRTKQIKQVFNLICVVLVVMGLIFLWLKMDIALLITALAFAVIVGFAQFANLCYIFFSTENDKVRIRYYQVISLLKKKYDSIEFPHQTLLNFQIERSLGGTDLTIAIRTKQGVAEYPTISLTALSKNQIEQIGQELEEIIRKNRRGI